MAEDYLNRIRYKEEDLIWSKFLRCCQKIPILATSNSIITSWTKNNLYIDIKGVEQRKKSVG